jgi:hypothetical protein
MKNLFLLLILFICAITNSFAQKIPAGMKYQAVARNSSGEILPSKNITLKIELKSAPDKGGKTYYSEEHAITTNQLGLFDLVVGEGKSGLGVFNNVPWSSEDIWMAVSLKEKGITFSAVTESRLLAVPYAFHAATAGKIISDLNAKVIGNDPGVPANVWSLQGNLKSDASKDRLGTTDYVDLVIITNNLERMRILANGDIYMKRSLNVGANITVDSSAYFNKKSGETINYGPFTVDRTSPTLLSGTLTVDGATDLNNSLNVDGPTDLNSRLFVNNASPTKLTGTLQVDGVTDLNNSFFVNNISPSVLTGTLRVDKDANFKEFVLLDGARATHESTSTTTGALVVFGGFGLGGNLNVGGESAFGGPVKFAAAVSITDLTESTSTTTGALIVGGGVGIGKRLNVGGGGLFESTLGVAGITSLTNNSQSTAIGNGALVVTGGVGIGQNLNVGGDEALTGALTVGGITNVNNILNVTMNGSYAANFTNNNASGNGISIKINKGTPSNSNNFINFQNSSGTTVGRIEGETLSEMYASQDYKNELSSKTYDVVSGALDVGLATYNLVSAIAFSIEAAASVNACAGLGIVACPPIASFVAGGIAEVIVAGIEEALVIAEVIVAGINLADYKSNMDNSVGVTYQSGAGDYAEYLMKNNQEEKFMAGDIVGVIGGKISKNIECAEKIMVISQKPIVLGNVPNEGAEHKYEKVAFMGQVPVKVFGKVNLGDYIIPNGLNNGIGIAVSPENITASDSKNIVGIAWTSAEAEIGLHNINVAVGLGINENISLIMKQQNEIDVLKNNINETNMQLERLVPGFKSQSAYPIAQATATISRNPGSRNIMKLENVADNFASGNVKYPMNMDGTQVQYYALSQQDFVSAFQIAEERLKSSETYGKSEQFWAKFNNDQTYKDSILNRVMGAYSKELESHKALDAKLNK